MTLVFNGDFNCFNVDHADFSAIHRPVARHHATLGNVKAELGADGAQARCGCAYPGHVDEDVVAHSNQIHARLKTTAAAHPGVLDWLASLYQYAAQSRLLATQYPGPLGLDRRRPHH